MVWANQTFNSDFILLGIFDHSPTHTFLFSLVLAVFTVACVGNSAMVLLIYRDAQLHTPMYFLLSQLSLMDLLLFCSCTLMAASSWILGSLDGIIVIIVTMSFPYCGGREIPHFFCDTPALLSLSCADTRIFEKLMFSCCVIMLVFPLAIIMASYTRVILAVIRMASGEGPYKAFATCSSHLLVVGMYYGAAMFIYMRPMSARSPTRDKMVSAFYTILMPMLNPLIYSLRNKEVSRAWMKVLGRGKSSEQLA
ncbi:olfactory receptor 2M5-like [Octodon degus]|uniref:Olfactory receptor 2M5-like n=1 Tax=Octodon degus TaxID=10160 RepID=A0A6P3V8Y6_OCTDE|nr:olfactory receptor 2M5-like [Octodon degus]